MSSAGKADFQISRFRNILLFGTLDSGQWRRSELGLALGVLAIELLSTELYTFPPQSLFVILMRILIDSKGLRHVLLVSTHGGG